MRPAFAKQMHSRIKHIASVGVFLTAVESRACAMWCSDVTDSVL
ncbi:MAG: hypothetical protein OFPII_02700 [Osedax symbiont Rs1]|nr:MAG: hypothetical protein OFPII_02700 [Osedax symbiont Rs1]